MLLFWGALGWAGEDGKWPILGDFGANTPAIATAFSAATVVLILLAIETALPASRIATFNAAVTAEKGDTV